jgi:hypothetical protein
MGVRGRAGSLSPCLIGVIGVLVAPLVLSIDSSAKVSLQLFGRTAAIIRHAASTCNGTGESRRDTTLNTDSVDPAIGECMKDFRPGAGCNSSIYTNMANETRLVVGEGPGCRLKIG